ncbi:MAP7 domain-containing protein 2-like isoform X2 [Phyllopteryx taeniolatus]|uniref:MAP7 domain-containing protein 2-like isoform X2 n=1 Tax=Phyllopteryx taeniolatus TaxID=161469 RepID=UPI002AD3D06E|nr:MAP7 domain-containing protein 2-like isoform X2 [Phyllopteryx taeniolatus]
MEGNRPEVLPLLHPSLSTLLSFPASLSPPPPPHSSSIVQSHPSASQVFLDWDPVRLVVIMTQVVPTHPAALTAPAPPPATPPTNRKASPCRSASSLRSPTELSEALRDKDCRARQQLERSGKERERKMAAQRRKEHQRRLAAEEKRQQKHEAEKERLEALVRRRAGGGGGGEARDHQDNRPKRWTWGGPPDGVEGNTKTPPCHPIGSALANRLPAASSTHQSRNVCEFLTPPDPSDQPMSKQLSNSSSDLHPTETASSNKHRPHRSSSNRRSIAAFPEDTARAKTPTGEVPSAPVRSSSFRANGKGPATPKRMRSSRSRAASPCSPGQYPPSPLRQRATTPGGDDRGHHGAPDRKSAKSETSEKKMSKSTSRELCAESPGTPTGRGAGGTLDAEEASRLLAERRRLARLQKEQEERQRQEDELLRAEEERRGQQEARELQERAARQADEERARREEERKSREEEERRQKEQRWKNMQEQLDKEREEAFQRAQREAERKRREREQLHIQEEQERLQRKKRIEEIMKRTRKSDVDAPLGAAACDVKSEIAALNLDEDAGTPAGTPVETPVVLLGTLENKSCLDELSDGVQSMDVSPVSRDEPASAQDFSPVADRCPLEHLMDVDPQAPPYPKLQAGSGVGDLNENLLIRAYNGTATESSPLIRSVCPGEVDV